MTADIAFDGRFALLPLHVGRSGSSRPTSGLRRVALQQQVFRPDTRENRPCTLRFTISLLNFEYRITDFGGRDVAHRVPVAWGRIFRPDF